MIGCSVYRDEGPTLFRGHGGWSHSAIVRPPLQRLQPEQSSGRDVHVDRAVLRPKCSHVIHVHDAKSEMRLTTRTHIDFLSSP